MYCPGLLLQSICTVPVCCYSLYVLSRSAVIVYIYCPGLLLQYICTVPVCCYSLYVLSRSAVIVYMYCPGLLLQSICHLSLKLHDPCRYSTYCTFNQSDYLVQSRPSTLNTTNVASQDHSDAYCQIFSNPAYK